MTDDLNARLRAGIEQAQRGETHGLDGLTQDLGPTELTREEAVELADDLGYRLYLAEDRLAFVREMLDRHTGPLDANQVRAWLDRPACMHSGSDEGPSVQTVVRILRHAKVSVLQRAHRELGWALEIGAEESTDGATDHTYLSTGCLHGEHAYCQGKAGAVGAKVPARCKFCPAPCVCPCHTKKEEQR